MNHYDKHANLVYWNNYYSQETGVTAKSSFAEFCLSYLLHRDIKLLELGCGNGRDAFYFASKGIDTTAIDMSDIIISKLQQRQVPKLRYKFADFTKYSNPNSYDAVYSRFTIHSINETDEKEVFLNTYQNLKRGGIFMIEARSLKDNMFIQSTKISATEGFTDHYRRFLSLSNTTEKLKSINFSILYQIESTGLAKYKDEDPMIIRIIAQKL